MYTDTMVRNAIYWYNGKTTTTWTETKTLTLLNVNVLIRTRITTTKLGMLTNAKDKVPKQNKSNVVYEITCPKCNINYIGKTDRTLIELHLTRRTLF